MWQCSKCGKPWQDGTLFCETCGDSTDQKVIAPTPSSGGRSVSLPAKCRWRWFRKEKCTIILTDDSLQLKSLINDEMLRVSLHGARSGSVQTERVPLIASVVFIKCGNGWCTLDVSSAGLSKVRLWMRGELWQEKQDIGERRAVWPGGPSWVSVVVSVVVWSVIAVWWTLSTGRQWSGGGFIGVILFFLTAILIDAFIRRADSGGKAKSSVRDAKKGSHNEPGVGKDKPSDPGTNQ